MRQRQFPGRGAALAALLLLLLAACGGPKVAPLVSLDGRACATGPELITAYPVALDAGKETKVAIVAADLRCIQAADGTRSSYVAFSLPISPARYLVTVRSEPLDQTLFSPRILLLDGLGNPVRELPRSVFMFHGKTLYAGVQADPGERYLVVASDPASIGEQVSQLKASVQDTYVSFANGGYGEWHMGAEKTSVLVFAHNGSISVTAQPMPKVN